MNGWLKLVLSLATAISASAFAAPLLLVPYEGPITKSAQPKGFKSEGFRVRFNLEGLKSLKPGEEVDLALPNGTTHTIVFDLAQDKGNGITSWVGYIKGSRDKLRVIITTGPGGSYGRISTPEGDYNLVPGDGHDWLVDMAAEEPHLPPIDLKRDTRVPPPQPKSLVPQLHAPEFLEPVPGVNTVSITKATPAPVFVDLMVVYTNGLSASLGANLLTRINQLVTSANTMYADSEVGIVLRLVGTTMVNYTDTNGDDIALDDITPVSPGPGPTFANIETLRAQYGADMVAFLRNGPSNGGSGIAWIANGPMGPGFSKYMYSVVTGCTAGCDWVFVHELGHNMGNQHDRATTAWQSGGAQPTGSYPYSYGYYSCSGGRLALNCSAFTGACVSQPECNTPRAGTNNFADIMAYFHQSTTRNMKFSNPQLNCAGAVNAGQACGVNDGAADSANAALSMNNNRVALSGLVPTKVATAPVASTTTLVSSANPVIVGQTLTFTATVSGSAGARTGTVSFNANGVTIAGCSAASLTNGIATCAASSLAVGTHTITAAYSGSAAYNPSTSAPLTQTINPLANPTVAVTSSVNPAVSGQPLTLYAVVSGSAGSTSAGTVEFRDGATPIAGCTAVAVPASGPASCTVSTLATGSHSITARFTGNANYNPATSPAIGQSIIVPAPAPGGTNVALASAGGVASASSTWNANFPTTALNNNERAGRTWAAGGAWADGTASAFPDWIQVNFNGSKTLDRVVLYTVQDDYTNPIEPTDTLTFAALGVTSFNVQGWDGAAWVTLVSVNGNNLVKRALSFTPYATDRIRVNITGSAAALSRLTELEAWGVPVGGTPPPPPPTGTNVALASDGAVATASSIWNANFPVAALNNNERQGRTWAAGGSWADGTAGAFPDWVQVQFNGSKSIDRVVVYSVQDNYSAPVEPTDTLTFTSLGVTSFTVEGWNGTAWVALGSASGNNLVKRAVTFPAFTTDRIRVNITGAAGALSRIAEIEAWGTASGSPPPPPPPAPTGSNIALASAGAVASASSSWNANFPVTALNNNERAGLTWAAGGSWADGTASAYPDWIQVLFSGTKTIDRVVVYSVQDNYTAPVEPNDSLTFTTLGLRNFTVEAWNGTAWVTLGSVSGNNLVKRTVTFAPVATDRIRVNITGAAGALSRVTEVEAWGS